MSKPEKHESNNNFIDSAPPLWLAAVWLNHLVDSLDLDPDDSDIVIRLKNDLDGSVLELGRSRLGDALRRIQEAIQKEEGEV